jgi:hypothetical protein
MQDKGSLGLGGTIILGVVAVAAILCGVHAILADSVTTPARFGGDHRVYGTDTVLIGVGWIFIGLSVMGKIVFGRDGGHFGSIVAVVLAIIGALFWVAAI